MGNSRALIEIRAEILWNDGSLIYISENVNEVVMEPKAEILVINPPLVTISEKVNEILVELGVRQKYQPYNS